MTAHAGEVVGKGSTYSLLVGVQIGTTTMEISIEVPQKSENQSTSISCFTILGYIHKGLYLISEVLAHPCSLQSYS